MAISLSLPFSMVLNQRPGGPLRWVLLSQPHLVTNGSELQTNWLPVFTELYNCSIAHSISLEWHVSSSSSGNNCYAIHRSLSSSASDYDCTMVFYLVPYCQPSPPTPMGYVLPPSLEWHVWPGRTSIYNETSHLQIIYVYPFKCMYTNDRR